MARFIPPVDRNELVLVLLERIWGSNQAKAATQLFRPTRAALEVLEYGIVHGVSQHVTEMPNIGYSARPGGICSEGDPVPEGSYLVDTNAMLEQDAPFSAEWLNVDIEPENGTVADLLISSRVGVTQFDFTLGNYMTPSSLFPRAGAMWLTPIRHLIDSCPEDPHDYDLARPPFAEYGTNRSGFWSNRAIPLGVLGRSNRPQPDNRMADGTPIEDWLQYDCCNRQLVQRSE
jgi:hypothetical protein